MANILLILLVLMVFFVVHDHCHDQSNNVAEVKTNDAMFEVRRPTCKREPPGFYKTPGDNGFKITLSAEKYVPGQSYTVKLHGRKTHASVQKFTKFILVVEPSITRTQEDMLNDVGSFELLRDTLIKFSDECQNTVTQTSEVPKSEVDVTWKAPRSGSGCVQLKATVQETGNMWYMDDGDLTKELCEENSGYQAEILEKCCACDEAKYDVTFQGLWSSHTHPKDYPQNKWLTHFSDVIGASHSPDYTMWQHFGFASNGLKKLAEYGITSDIESEMKDQANCIRTIIKARGLWYPNLNCSTFAVFRVDQLHHLVSLVTMMGPSPDWITGISQEELCQKNCTWAAQKTFDLYPWDAGTDDGITYMSEDKPRDVRERIRQITATYPNDPQSAFYDPSGTPMKPVAKLTLTRQRIYEKSCDSKLSLATDEPTEFEMIKEDERMECAVTEWGAYDECSVTCGKGLKARHRHYLMPTKATMFNCNTDLKQMEMCAGAVTYCDEENQKWREDPIKCATSTWTDWSECDAECGVGFRERTRKFLDRKAFKTCKASTKEKEKCMSDVICDGPAKLIDSQCQVTQWSEWSPCMVTCGTGMQMRTRLFLHAKSKSMCSLELMEKRGCTAEKTDCNFDRNEAMKICNQPRIEGPCRGYFIRWYFDTTKRVCMQFVFGGCRGNQNNFPTAEDCNSVCEIIKVPIDSPIVAHQNLQAFQKLQNMNKGFSVDCMMTPWSGWSECSEKCGGGKKFRQRNIKVHPKNGGKSCPGRMEQKKSCNNKPCLEAIGVEHFDGSELEGQDRTQGGFKGFQI